MTSACASNAMAWGDTGHKVICEIAWREMAPATQAKIKALLQHDAEFGSFADACIWPDHPRQRATEHYVNLPRDAAGFAEQDPCGGADACILSAIAADTAVLASPADDRSRLSALKFLGHWIGDVHQPMHVSFADDRGGNRIDVLGACSDGRYPNLHAAWDTCLVEQTLGRDVPAIATRLLGEITPAQKETWSVTAPLEWANESFAITTAAATQYCVHEQGACFYQQGNETLEPDEPPKQVLLDPAYIEANSPIIQEQMKKAGVRLAHVLDQALAKPR